MIHVMAAARLGRPAMAAPVMRDHAETMAQKEQHLRIPIVRRKRPAVAEHDRLPAAPILVENLGPVPRGDRRHFSSLPKLEPPRLRCGKPTTTKIGRIDHFFSARLRQNCAWQRSDRLPRRASQFTDHWPQIAQPRDGDDDDRAGELIRGWVSNDLAIPRAMLPATDSAAMGVPPSAGKRANAICDD